jgi:hypothetical protein
LETETNYLRDLLNQCLEHAREAKADYASARTQLGESDAQFQAGKALAYYEVLSLAVHQLRAFGLNPASYGFPQDFDVERELL